MTAVDHAYRILIYEADDDTTVDFSFQLDTLSGPPIVTGIITHPTAGRTETRPFSVLAIDKDGILSAELTEQAGGFGRWRALGRRVDVQVAENGGGFTTYGTGRISALDEADGPGRYRIEISDESWIARKARIFTIADTTQLWPQGVRSDWRGFVAAEAGESFGFVSTAIDGVSRRIHVRHGRRGKRVTDAFRTWLDEHLEDEPTPVGSAAANSNNFGPLRINYAGVDYTILSFAPGIAGGQLGFGYLDSLDADLAVDGDAEGRFGFTLWIVAPDPIPPPQNGQPVFLYSISDAPSEDLPLHVGIADAAHDWGTTNGWIHPATLTRRIWDQIGLRYDSASLAALEADTSYPHIAPRVEQQVEDAEKWCEDQLWGPLLLMALRTPDGQRKLIDMRLPQDLDPDTLPLLGATNTRANTWRLIGTETINSVTWSYLHHIEPSQDRRAVRKGEPRDLGPSFNDAKLDGFVVEEREADPVTATTLGDPSGDTIPEIGRRSLSLKLLGPLEPTSNQNRGLRLVSRGGSNWTGVKNVISRDLFDIFQDGAFKLRGQVGRSVAETLTEGDLVLIDLGSIGLPNPASGARSDLRLVRVMSITRHPAHAEIEYLDLGPSAQPLAAPTVDIAWASGTPNIVTVTLSDIPAGATAELQVAYTNSSSEPDAWSIRRTELGNGVFTFRNVPAGGFAHVRARSIAPHRIRSVWASDFVALDDRPAILDAALSLDGGGVPTLALEASSATMGIRLRFDIRDQGEDPSYGAASDHAIGEFPLVIAGVVVPGSQALSVEIEPWTGFSAGTVQGTAGDIVEVHTDRGPVDLTLAMRATVQDLTPGVEATIRVAVADPLPASNITLAYEQSGTGNVTPGSPQTIPASSVTSELSSTGFVTFDVDLAGTPGQITFTATSPGRNPASQTVGFAAPGQDGEPGADGAAGPNIIFFKNFGGTVATDVAIGLEHTEDDTGLLEVWVNPSGTSSPDREGPPDGSVAVGPPYPVVLDDSTVFGGAGRLLNNIPVSGLEDKTIYARFTDSQSRVDNDQVTLRGIIDVVDPFGILVSADPGGLVESLALKLVTNPNMGERAVSFKNLVIGSYDNLISDPSFEAAGDFGGGLEGLDQAGWAFSIQSGGTWDTTTTNPFSGTYACIYNRSGQSANARLGTAQGGPGAGARAISASQGDRHYFQARARNSGAGSGGQVRVEIRYTDVGGNQLALHNSNLANLNFSYQVVSVAVPENQPAPAGTAHVQFRLLVENAGTIDNILWDDCFARLMVDGTLIVDGAILAKHVSAGSITTPKLAANAATFSKVSIGSLGNMIPDPIFSSGALTDSDWTVTDNGGGTWSIQGGLVNSGNFAAAFNRTGQTTTARLRHAATGMEAIEGDEFFFRASASPSNGGAETTAGVAIVFRGAAGGIVGALTDTNGAPFSVWTQSSQSATAPAGTARVDFELRCENDGNASVMRFDDCFAQKMVAGELIVDGAIIARHIDVLTLEVGQFIRSSGYVAGSSGWFLGFDGSDDEFFEANTGVFRGELNTAQLTADNTTITYSAGSGLIIDREAAGASNLDFARNGSLEAFIGLTSSDDLQLDANGDAILIQSGGGGQLGFFGTSSAAKQQVLGSTGGNVALQNLLTALENYGLITDGTT